ncbi:MAG: hypothetical protein ACTSWN_06155, partial [Promethearchaeota archaeon]
KKNKRDLMVCQDPYCNHVIPLPKGFLDNARIKKSDKKCLICPMNAVIYEKGENLRFYICINCYNKYRRSGIKEIGFCLGCVYHDECFKDESEKQGKKLSLIESVKRRMQELAFNSN